jgi:HSP20 family protein
MPVPGGSELPINAFETDESLVVVVPMPGVEPEDIAVRLEGEMLTMESGVRGEDAEKRYLHHEWSYGPYRRTLRLPTPVDARAANVTFGNGVLTVVLPKGRAFVPATLDVPRTALARGMREGHTGS